MGGVFRETGDAHANNQGLRFHVGQKRLRKKRFAHGLREFGCLLAIGRGQEHREIELVIMSDEIELPCHFEKLFSGGANGSRRQRARQLLTAGAGDEHAHFQKDETERLFADLKAVEFANEKKEQAGVREQTGFRIGEGFENRIDCAPVQFYRCRQGLVAGAGK